jgi:CheY-like chemotaxis protein
MRKHNPTLLIVEDDPNDQLILRRGFAKIGMTGPIHTANDGLDAIAYMMGEGRYSDRQKFPYPTFIITDLKMPGADGFAVLEFLKANPEWAVIPTVVFSSSTDLDDIKKAYCLGASSYHVKPGNHEALIHQLIVLNAYWRTCEVPEVDSTGRQMHTDSRGKLGERFAQAGDESPQAEIERAPGTGDTPAPASKNK